MSGQDLKQLRKQAGLTQAEAAKLARIPKRTWENWEFRVDSPHYRRPSGLAFTFLEMYILLKNNGIKYEPME